jgi:methylmalonyl-CoA mutase cobalamin-binding subunit
MPSHETMEFYSFLGAVLSGVAGVVYIGTLFIPWTKSKLEGRLTPFVVKRPGLLLALVLGCIGLACVGMWLELHRPPPSVATAPPPPALPSPQKATPTEARPPAKPKAKPQPPKRAPENVPPVAPPGAEPSVQVPAPTGAAQPAPTYGGQTCIGSACAQGPDSQATYNQYGAPKLSMSDAQRDAIRDAMKPYAGMQSHVSICSGEDDSRKFGEQLVQALQSAGLSVTHKESLALITGGANASGVSIIFSVDHQEEAKALEQAMSEVGVKPTMVLINVARYPSFLNAVVEPNK